MLSEIQARLEKHFLSLRHQRAELGYPVYALEHGLASFEMSSIRTTLSNNLRRQKALSVEHWLLWVIVAAEIGYSYNGEEYWTSFEQAIPTWQTFGNRETIRDWFAIFTKRYAGFSPTGRWAKHFSIIAWPIAHSVLPRDLQGQFARHLYDLRYQLASRANATVEEIGLTLETPSPNASQRFQHFLQQTELTARLVLALRDEDVQDAVPAIHRPTLARIVADLEGRQSARDWLREARIALRNARMRGSVSLLGSRNGLPPRSEIRVESANSVRLVARQSSEGKWLVGIWLPDFGQLIKDSGVSARSLNGTRVRLANRPSNWMPGRALFTLARNEQRTSSLHDLIGQPVLTLERGVRGLGDLWSDALCIKGSSPWLLRVQDDGVARQVIGNHVRTSQSYLIISDVLLPPAILLCLKLREMADALSDYKVYFLATPPVLKSKELEALASLKIGYALRANIEPVGLVPRWDGANECTVWLTTERPLLRLSADHPIQEFIVSIDHQLVVRVPVSGSHEVIISLGDLSVGPHLVEVGGTALGRVGTRLEPERLELSVRSPMPWMQGARDRAGFRPILEPPGASLENVLAGKAHIVVLGPAKRSITLDVKLFNLNGHLTEHFCLGSIASLADPSALRRLLAKLTKEPMAEKVQTAPRVDIVFLADELGADSLSFQRKMRPFRWQLAFDGHEYRTRLIDEAGTGQPILLRRYDLTHPDRKADADYMQFCIGISIAPPGALLTAICENKRYSAIISTPTNQRLTALNDLGLSISISSTNNEPKHIPRLLGLLRLWGRAQQVLGPLGMLRKAQVCEEFERRVASILCGNNWTIRAHQCHSIEDPAIDILRREIGASPGFGARLRERAWHNADQDPLIVADFARLAATYRVCDDSELCTLALRVAFDPANIRWDTPDKGLSNWVRLAQLPVLTRGAYFARRVSDLDNISLTTGAVE